MPDYTPIPYPKWKYNASLPPVIVGDPSAEAALGAGWSDTPDFPAEPELDAPDIDPATEN